MATLRTPALPTPVENFPAPELPVHSISPPEAARLAHAVYGGPDNDTLPPGWQLAALPVAGVELEQRQSGFHSVLYERRNADGSRTYAYVTRGTDVWQRKDWVTDVLQALGANTRQYAQSARNARLLHQALAGQVLVFIGHSLGGGLASMNALATGRDAITFNAAGLSPGTRRREQLPDSGAAAGSTIEAFVLQGEIVGRVQRALHLVPEGRLVTIPIELPLTGEDEDGQKNRLYSGLGRPDGRPAWNLDESGQQLVRVTKGLLDVIGAVVGVGQSGKNHTMALMEAGIRRKYGASW